MKRAAATAPPPANNTTNGARVAVPPPKTNMTAQEQQARVNYGNVIDELNAKLKVLKDGCYPRPKGIHLYLQ